MKPFDETISSEWIVILGELGYFGKKKQEIYAGYDFKYGSENWSKAHLLNGKVSSSNEAIVLYEDGYFNFLKKNNAILEWLVELASDVYDISPSNVHSELDYSIQECSATHLQDIAVRRAVKRLGREFKGKQLLQIRGFDTQGYVLNPGKVPFHLPEMVLDAHVNAWWDRGSIEDFYQTTKVLLVHPEQLMLTPDIRGPNGEIYYRNTKQDYYLPTAGQNVLKRVEGRLVRRLTHEKAGFYTLPPTNPIPYSSLLNQ